MKSFFCQPWSRQNWRNKYCCCSVTKRTRERRPFSSALYCEVSVLCASGVIKGKKKRSVSLFVACRVLRLFCFKIRHVDSNRFKARKITAKKINRAHFVSTLKLRERVLMQQRPPSSWLVSVRHLVKLASFSLSFFLSFFFALPHDEEETWKVISEEEDIALLLSWLLVRAVYKRTVERVAKANFMFERFTKINVGTLCFTDKWTDWLYAGIPRHLKRCISVGIAI
jgi:hypothetical protein